MPPEVSVSVVIPTHNRSRFIRGCLHSALAQVGVDVEVIVIDDGSTDDTQVRLRDLRDSRVRVITHERPLGQAVARNDGIRAARGRWVAFLDDDDLWAPDKLRLQVAAGEDADAALVYCGAVAFFENSDDVLADRPVPSAASLPESIFRGNPLPGGASAQMARKDVLDRLGGFAEDLDLLTDWDMWIRLVESGPVVAVDERLVAYRFHDSNLTSGDADSHLAEFDRFVDKHRAGAAARNVAIDGVGFHHWQASAQRRAGHHWKAGRLHLNAAIKYRDLGHLGCAVRSPLGDRAMGLRSKPPEQAPAAQPRWLHDLRALAA